jgi:hypothetical protein
MAFVDIQITDHLQTVNIQIVEIKMLTSLFNYVGNLLTPGRGQYYKCV